MKIQFLGHSAFYLETEKFKALIDPFLQNGITKATVSDFEELDYIFVTHGHGDHVGDTLELAEKTGATVILNHELAHHLGKTGIKLHSMHIGGRISFDFGRVKMTPALHGSSIVIDGELKEGGNPCGFIIEVEGKKIYHAGDTGLTLDMTLLEVEAIDLALLPIGGNFTMDVEDAVRAVSFIKPKKVIPMHYDTFPVIKADVQTFKDAVSAMTEVIILKGDAIYEL